MTNDKLLKRGFLYKYNFIALNAMVNYSLTLICHRLKASFKKFQSTQSVRDETILMSKYRKELVT